MINVHVYIRFFNFLLSFWKKHNTSHFVGYFARVIGFFLQIILPPYFIYVCSDSWVNLDQYKNYYYFLAELFANLTLNNVYLMIKRNLASS